MASFPLRLVLLRPRNAQNVGAVARAMKNFGVTDWAWVDPKFESLEPAEKLAVHAEELLHGARRVKTLEQAVADCAWVVGTSSRHVRGKLRFGPREWAAQAVERAPAGRVALVLGDERSGMTNEDVARCHDLSAIAAMDEQPSLNLAQAALLYCHELYVARLAAAPRRERPSAAAASFDELSGVEAALRRALLLRGFLHPPERHAVRDLMAPLQRAQLSRKEARLWRAALEAVAK